MEGAGAAVQVAATKTEANASSIAPQRTSLGERGMWAIGLSLAAAFFVRAMHPNIATAYMDETIYILYGRMFLSRHFESPIDTPLRWSFGWYLWPMMAATADRIGGIVALREFAAALGTATVFAVYGFARRVFSIPVALASAAVFALLGPAVFSSRIATHDAGVIFFFSYGAWLFARGWQEDDRKSWGGAAALFFAAFLCKYLVCIFFPVLAILAFTRKERATLWFVAPLASACAAYGLYNWDDLVQLLRYAHSYRALHASAAETWNVYFARRIDFWVLFPMGLIGTLTLKGKDRLRNAVLLLMGLVMPVFQMISRPDADYWKHVTYSLLFLTPLAMDALIRLMRRAGRWFPAAVKVAVVILLSVSLAIAGNSFFPQKGIFWPDLDDSVNFLQGQIHPGQHVLVDDTALRYYFAPPLTQSEIVDPYYFSYKGARGEPAYQAAAKDGYFDFVVFANDFDDARQLQNWVRPYLSDKYILRASGTDQRLNVPYEIYEARNHAVPSPGKGARIQITTPVRGASITTPDMTTKLEGAVAGAQNGWYVVVDVYTNRWYQQGDKIPLDVDGRFSQQVMINGSGPDQCHHLLRARVFDQSGNYLAGAAVTDVTRANADGSVPACASPTPAAGGPLPTQ